MNPNQNPNPNVMGQSVNPDTYNEHQPGLQPSTPQHPNPENEPSVFGPFGSTQWIDKLADAMKQGQVSSIRSTNGQIQIQGTQGAPSPLQGQLSAAVQGLFQRDDITCIRCTPDGGFEVDTKDGKIYQAKSLRAALQQIPNLDLTQPFTMQGQQPNQPAPGQQPQNRQQPNRPGNMPGNIRPSGQR